MQPKQSDIDKAKEYIRQRLGAELSMITALESLMKDASRKIVMVVYEDRPQIGNFLFSDLSAKAQYKIEQIIRWLRESTEECFNARCIPAEEQDNENILLWVKRGKNGITFDSKLDEYLNKFATELETLIDAGLFLGLTSSVVARSIGLNLKHPYVNPDLIDGMGRNISYGRGRTNSMYTAISNLTRFGIASGWNRSKLERENKRGALGWVVKRGSSYPCDICDDNCGFYPSIDMVNLPVHPHCCCYAVPIFD